MNRLEFYFKIGLLTGILILANLVTGCGCLRHWVSGAVEFHIHNKTDQVIYVYHPKGAFIDEVAPGEKTVWGTVGWFDQYEFVAKDEEGLVLYQLLYRSPDVLGKWKIDVYFPPEDERYDNTPTRYRFFQD